MRQWVTWGGLAAGPLLALLMYHVLPESYVNDAGDTIAFTVAGRATLAVMVWMATWWLTEALPISTTALLPIAVFPVLGIATIKAATAPYASDIIFLFMGGFILALSMQRWGLDRRIALITLRLVGTSPPRMIAGFMLVTAVLSMWVSNTATAAMMLPIALSVIDLVLRQRGEFARVAAAASDDSARAAEGVDSSRAESLDEMNGSRADAMAAISRDSRNFALSLMLGIAYAASIGGIGTIIGSPPNGILVKFMAETYQREISFLQWMAIGMPIVIIFLPLAWMLITWVLYPFRMTRIEGGPELLQREYASLGPMKSGEWATFIVFMCTAIAWITRPLLSEGIEGTLQPIVPGLSDAGVAMIGALLLFLIPVEIRGRGRARGAPRFTMNWETAAKLPWGILILFGGGLSLASAVEANGVAHYIGSIAANLGGWPAWLLVAIVTAGVIFLTELTSNTATTATLVPILAGLAPGLGVEPELLIVPATIAASCAFMMPVATPPNAIVFGAGYVTIPQMCKAGLWLNLAGIVVISLLAFVIVKPLLR